VGSLRLSGLEPGVIAGDQFRLLIGARDLRSTAFSMDRSDDVIEFNGRGYGHGVGMCVIGAGRRARRGESVQQILAQYYPGLEITALGNTSTRVKSETVVTAVNQIPNPKSQIPNPESQLPNPRLAPSSTATAPVTLRGTLQTSELQQAVARAHQAVTRLLGVTAAPVTIDVHDTVEGFRQATGKPWWASASVSGNTVDLAPLTLLAQREGVETTLRAAIAQAVMAAQLQGRPEWVRVGGARYFSHATLPSPPDRNARLRCPADAELTLAISATAQREAEARAEACFARAYAASRDWKAVK
jgi:hypothetical protein